MPDKEIRLEDQANEEESIADLDETEDQESTADDTDDQTDDTEDQEESTDDSEPNDAEYLESLGVSGYDSVEDYIKATKDQATRLERLESERKLGSGDKDESVSGDDDAFKDLLLDSGNAANTVKQFIENGSINEKDAPYFRSLAKVVDQSLDPSLKKLGQINQFLFRQVATLTRAVRESSWRGFEHKSLVKKSDLDSVMDKQGLTDYGDAALAWALEHKKSLVPKLMQSNGDGNRPRRFRRSTSGKRTGSRGIRTTGKIYERYLTPGIGPDPAKMAGLPTERKLKIINAFKADLAKAAKEAAR